MIVSFFRYAIAVHAFLVPLAEKAFADTDRLDRQTDSIAFENVTVIDISSAALLENRTVLVIEDRIARVAPATSAVAPAGARRIDASGKYLIPGLIDAHVHTWYAGIDHRGLFIANGVTAVRDMAAPWAHLDEIRKWRKEITEGVAVGPRMWATGQPVVGVESEHPWAIKVADAEQARQAVRRLEAAGADFVKILNHLPPDAFYALMEEARARKLPVAGHVPRELTVLGVAEAGVASIEHVSLGGLMLASAANEAEARDRLLGGESYFSVLPDLHASLDPDKALRVYGELRLRNVAVSPTISFFATLAQMSAGGAEAIRNDWMRYVPASYGELWAKQAKAVPAALMTANFEKGLEALRVMKASGVSVLAGTDVIKPYLVPGFSLHQELSLLVEAGFSEQEALYSATRETALFLGQEKLGLIQEGMLADFVLLDNDPLTDIANTRKIWAVVADGRLYERGDLDQMLSEIEAAAEAWAGEPSTFP